MCPTHSSRFANILLRVSTAPHQSDSRISCCASSMRHIGKCLSICCQMFPLIAADSRISCCASSLRHISAFQSAADSQTFDESAAGSRIFGPLRMSVQQQRIGECESAAKLTDVRFVNIRRPLYPRVRKSAGACHNHVKETDQVF